MLKKAILIFAGVIVVHGCAVFTPPMQKPLIEKHLDISKGDKQNIGILATTPERRIVLINTNSQLFCSEPSPDVAQAFTESISTIANASASSTKNASDKSVQASAELYAQLAKQLATNNSQLFYRSQGVQLFRDASFSLCQAYLNGALKGDLATAAAAASVLAKTSKALENTAKSGIKEPATLKSQVNNISEITKTFPLFLGKDTTFNLDQEKISAIKENVDSLQNLNTTNESDVKQIEALARQINQSADAIKKDIKETVSDSTEQGNYTHLFLETLRQAAEIIKLEAPSRDTARAEQARDASVSAQSAAERARDIAEADKLVIDGQVVSAREATTRAETAASKAETAKNEAQAAQRAAVAAKDEAKKALTDAQAADKQ